MAENIIREPLSFTSADGETTIHGYIWRDQENSAPKGIVQIAHGMAEHIERYDGFANLLVEHGYVVCGHNHLGHGSSVSSKDKWGCLPAKEGKAILIADVNRVRQLVAPQFPEGTPYFLFGHSLGSYIARAYITRHGEGLAGAIICGTGHVAPATSNAGNKIASIICSIKGKDYRSKFLDNMGVGAYAKAIEDKQTDLDWLSFNADNVKTYIADEACGFMFSAGGYATVTSLTAEVCTPASAARIPRKLPLLYIAGDHDPVGSNGEGVKAAAKLATDAGVEDVNVIIYEHMRHEILNETDAGRVHADVLSWLDAHLS